MRFNVLMAELLIDFRDIIKQATLFKNSCVLIAERAFQQKKDRKYAALIFMDMDDLRKPLVREYFY